MAALAEAQPPTAEEIAQLEGVALLKVLRDVGDYKITRKVYMSKRATWTKDPRWGGMAHHLVADVHPMFRTAFALVLSNSTRANKVDIKGFTCANSSLRSHHSIEDTMWFPRIREEHTGDVAAQVRLLEQDHAELVTIEERVMQGSMEAILEFVNRLEELLDLEELLLVPLLLEGKGGL